MLRHRLIPVVLLDGYSVVKTIRFDVRRNLGNPITVARIYNTRNVDELVLLDIEASKQGRHIDEYTIEDVASECFMPLTVGGGIRTCEHIASVLRKGADKVVINAAAIDNPGFIREASAQFGEQCIVVSIDVIREGGRSAVYSHTGEHAGFSPLDWARMMEDNGAGEIVLNAVHCDGVMEGYDLAAIEQISRAVRIPVIAVGGCGVPRHAVEAIEAGASAVGAASIFHFTDYTPNDVKAEMNRCGIPVRMLSSSTP